MNKNLLSKLSLMGLFALLTACAPGGDKRAAAPKPVAKSPLVVPVPAEFSAGTGAFRVDAATVLVYSGGAGAAEAAKYFDELAQQDPQLTVRRPREDDSESNAISFVRVENDTSFGPEAYAIVAKPDGVTVKARTPAGLLYGAVTLWQLLTLATPQNGIGQIPALEIRDTPRFAWRGLMLDSARHYQSPEYIKKFIDNMAQHKLNVLHWHLTDDQAWRLEIKKYPKLTSVGAWRVPEGQAPRADIDPKTGKPRLHGGFYTQAQARDIVAFAAARNVKVIPEIEMPGHASAAIVAYPELGVAGAPPLKEVPSDWGVYENLFNVEESTFKFLENVLTEVIEVFPSEYIHVGGDEAVKPQWEKSPRIQARMKEFGIPDAHHLQGYFIQRMARFIESKGRRVIGWDEILEGGIPPNAAIMSWRGIDGAIAAAKAGHDTVLSPAPDLYLDHWQSAGDLSPGRSNTLSLEMVYGFQPVPASIPEEQRKHILGVQANLWTEMMRTEARVDYMTFPRISALAEVAWSPAERINWDDFQRRLDPQLRRYDKAGIVWAREVELRPLPLRRLSHDLDQCSDGYLLSLEDDAPIEGERAVFLVNISNPCWIWRGADLSGSRQLRAVVGQIPFNFQIGADAASIPLHKPETPEGELELRLDGCDGPPLDKSFLKRAASNFGLTELVPLDLKGTTGTHDLCLRFTRSKRDPIWVIGSLELAGS